jgi:pimeloyl-ACP methyl ester carboxylesterase
MNMPAGGHGEDMTELRDSFFDGFTLDRVDVGEVNLRVRHGGSGPGLLLLHGHPRTHTTWHRVAPQLAESYTVVCPDLRGYGKSSKPPTDAAHAPYSKRVMANDCVNLMRALGHERFVVAGHDRGSYVALRLALDHPDAIGGLIVMDSVPIGEALARCDAQFAQAWWHWFFLGQPETPSASSTPIPTRGTTSESATHPNGSAAKTSKTSAPPSTTPRRCTPWSRTTAPGSASTATTTTPTAQPTNAWRALPSSCGPSTMTSKTSTEIHSPYGAHGQPTYQAAASTQATTWPRTPQTNSSQRSANSSANSQRRTGLAAQLSESDDPSFDGALRSRRIPSLRKITGKPQHICAGVTRPTESRPMGAAAQSFRSRSRLRWRFTNRWPRDSLPTSDAPNIVEGDVITCLLRG